MTKPNFSGMIFIGDVFKECQNKTITAFDGKGKIHCLNTTPPIVMIGRTR